MGNQRDYHLHDGKFGAAITVHIVPRASKSEIVEIQSDGTWKIRLAGLGADAEINRELVRFLSEVLAISSGQIEIVAGEKGNNKIVSILKLDKETVQERVSKHLKK